MIEGEARRDMVPREHRREQHEQRNTEPRRDLFRHFVPFSSTARESRFHALPGMKDNPASMLSLQGVRAIEFCQIAAGPFAGELAADIRVVRFWLGKAAEHAAQIFNELNGERK